MLTKIKEPVSVISSYNHLKKTVKPVKILWRGRTYDVLQIGLHHTARIGRTLMHIFSVTSNSLAFRLSLNTDNLHWTLEEISDGTI